MIKNWGRGDRDSGSPDVANLLEYGFNAQKSNSLYSKSSTVQPSSYRVHYLIKF